VDERNVPSLGPRGHKSAEKGRFVKESCVAQTTRKKKVKRLWEKKNAVAARRAVRLRQERGWGRKPWAKVDKKRIITIVRIGASCLGSSQGMQAELRGGDNVPGFGVISFRDRDAACMPESVGFAGKEWRKKQGNIQCYELLTQARPGTMYCRSG